jgi:hypothetical protein
VPPTIYRYDIADAARARVPRAGGAGLRRRRLRDEAGVLHEQGRHARADVPGAQEGPALDGNNPTLLYGYGGFNITQSPSFNALRLALLEQGVVYASANLRGGGEYGEKWHEAGTKLKKQNVFDDFIAAAEWLIANKYTSPAKLAIQGGSNGGLLVGAVMNQRPELFRVAIPQVGVMDMLRFHKFTIGWNWIADYGSSDNPEEFKALHAYSPLHNIRAGVKYPATLITTADHDDRVVPAHSFKYAATLQAKASPEHPALIRIETKSGHGASNLTKQLETTADIYAFILHNLGVPSQLHRDQERGGDEDDPDPRLRVDRLDPQDELRRRQVERRGGSPAPPPWRHSRNGFENGLIRKTERCSERAVAAWNIWNSTIVVSATVCAAERAGRSSSQRNIRSVPDAHDDPGDHGALPEQPEMTPSRAGRGGLRQHVRLARLEGERDVLQPVGHQVEPQQLGRQHRQRPAEHQRAEDHEDRGGAGRDEEERDLAQVVEGDPPFLDRGVDAREVVVGEDHVGGLAGDVGAALAHRDADLGGLERRGVVDAVAGHGHDLAAAWSARTIRSFCSGETRA